jgi:hypothetical protein
MVFEAPQFDVAIRDSLFVDNSVEDAGGAVYADIKSLILRNVSFLDNYAATSGGRLRCSSRSPFLRLDLMFSLFVSKAPLH